MNLSNFHRIAALDNAELCADMWRAHGLGVERGAGLLACSGTPPRFYPNAVTIDPDASPSAQMRVLARRAARTPGPFFVKDSFTALAMGSLGFEPLFEARWIYRPAGAPASATRLAWRPVLDAATLADWEVAWSGGADEPPLFLPAFLAKPAVTMLAGWDEGAIVAGCVVTVRDGVVGLSNVFGEAAEAVDGAALAFPDRDLVGYEQGDALAAALDAGFQDVGGLVVWERRES